MSNQDENKNSSDLGENLSKKPIDTFNKGKKAWNTLRFAKGAVLFLKKILASIISWLLSLVGPYVLIIIIIIILLLLVLQSVSIFDLHQEGNKRTDAAVIFDETVKTTMEDLLIEGPNDAKTEIQNTQLKNPYPPISQGWLDNTAAMLKQSIAVPTIHHYFKNIESESYQPWHKKYEKDNASNPDALREKYKRIISDELRYYFEGTTYEPQYTWGKPPVEEYIETTTTTSCTVEDDEGNLSTSVTGPTTVKKVLDPRDIVLDVTVGYTKGVISYITSTTETSSTSSSGDCTTDTHVKTVLYIVNDAVPLAVEFLPNELVKMLILEGKEGKRTQLVQVQDLEYSIDLGKEIDPLFPRPEIEYKNLKKCVQKKNSDIEACIDQYVKGGTFALNFGSAGASGSWFPQEYEALYKKYAKLAGIDWFILAAVHGQETTFSKNPVATDPSKGSYNSRGELIGAIGHFQFMPATWVGWSSMKDFDVTPKGAISGDISFIKVPANIKKYGGKGVDGNGDGIADPWNIEDSMYAAALYIKSYGYVSKNEAVIKTALAKYNGGPTYYVSGEAQKYASQVYANAMRFEKGQSVTGSISVAPGDLTYPTVGRLTSGYGMRNIALYGYAKMHYGTDIANKSGTPIVSVADGVVVKAQAHATWGNYVKIQHNVNGQQFQTLYAHMRKLHVTSGMNVKKGTQIGEMGTTGSSSGVHLHLEVYLPPYSYPGSLVNPVTIVPMPPQ